MSVIRQKYILFALWLFFIATGVVSGFLYQASPGHLINLKAFQQELAYLEETAVEELQVIEHLYNDSSFQLLVEHAFPHDDITFYIVEENELFFWSDNHIDIDDIYLYDFDQWEYVQLPNADCIALSRTIDGVRYLALITIKYNYPYENDKLINRFAHGLRMDKRVVPFEGNADDEYPVFTKNGEYLFSLEEPESPVYNQVFSIIAAIAFALAFLVFFFFYARFPLLTGRKYITLKTFLLLFAGVGALVTSLLYFNIPTLFFRNELFLPFDYAANSVLSSITHLSVFTAYIIASLCLFFFFVRYDKKYPLFPMLILLAIYPAYFLGLYFVLRSLVFNSSTNLNIFHLTDFSVIGVWAHLLLLIWGFGLVLLFFKTHQQLWLHKGIRKIYYWVDIALFVVVVIVSFFIQPQNAWTIFIPYLLLTLSFYLAFRLRDLKGNNYLYLILWSVLYAFFIGVNISQFNFENNKQKYRVLAENVYVNGNVENDRIADVLLGELDKQLMDDPRIGELLYDPDSVDIAQKYLDETYFRGFWNKYDVQLSAALKSSESYDEYLHYTEHIGYKIKGTHFYSVPNTQNAMTYIGIFPGGVLPHLNDSVYYYMEFYPRRQYKSYSFPDLLIPSSVHDIHSQMDVAIAKYDNGQLTYASGAIDYPTTSGWIPLNISDTESVFEDDLWHYIYQPNDETYIVVSRQSSNSASSYFQFLVYLALIYFVLGWIATETYKLVYDRKKFSIGLAARFQYTFILLFIISFVAIFYVSVDFIKQRYQKQQIGILENKRNYIQEALQDKYYWNQELDMHNSNALNFDLQELSYTFQTDIHVFDNNGILLGSSQPLIFYRHLISDRMASRPFFSADPSVEQYENIGDLHYLVAYMDFYNWDYLQIGYIAVPQFFSQEDMQAEIENFSSVIIHIYLVIIILAIILAVVIGRRLSAPLKMLERKLRDMRLGRRNEKIEYRVNDEIGQLVAQYNRTVDELEQSARLLAKSERESAWRSMARQVAHEINNPLTPMKLSIQQLQRRKSMDDEGFDEYFSNTTTMLIEQIDSLARIAGTFSNFARMPEAKMEKTDVSTVLQSVVRLFVNNNKDINVVYDGPDSDVYVYADSEQLVQVFNNLIKNAIQAIPDNRQGLILVMLRQNEKTVTISVTDNGVGVSDEVRDKMFVPNFTTKATGMGLGLAISKNIIEQAGGTIRFETKANKGSTFIVELPL